MEPGKTLLGQALARIAEHPEVRKTFGDRRPRRRRRALADASDKYSVLPSGSVKAQASPGFVVGPLKTTPRFANLDDLGDRLIRSRGRS